MEDVSKAISVDKSQIDNVQFVGDKMKATFHVHHKVNEDIEKMQKLLQ